MIWGMRPTKKIPLSPEEFRNTLDYSPETGIFTWKNATQKHFNGKEAGYFQASGYKYIGISGIYYLASRLAWYYYYGIWPDELIDHIDRNKSNDAISNLRQASYQQNSQNRTHRTRQKFALPLGVYSHSQGRRFHAQIRKGRDFISLGSFDSPEEAHEAYRKASLELFGEFSPFYSREAA